MIFLKSWKRLLQLMTTKCMAAFLVIVFLFSVTLLTAAENVNKLFINVDLGKQKMMS